MSELADLALRLAGGDRDSARGFLAAAIDEVALMTLAEARETAAKQERRVET